MSILALLALAAPLADLRVGQSQAAVRIEVVCAGPCEGTLEDGALLLSGVEADLAVPLTGGPVTGIALAEAVGGTRLTYETSAPPRRAALTPCGERAVCLDLSFVSPKRPAVAAASQASRGESLRDDLAAAAGDPLDPGACDAASARLDADAWDLAAFRRVALCRAAAGRLTEAAGLLDRLLAWRDDPAAARARAVLARRLDDEKAPG